MANIYELTDNKVVLIRPTESGDGFVKGQIYEAWRGDFHAFTVTLPGGIKRILSTVNEPSAHLWDGTDWDAAGHFELVNPEAL